MARSTEDELRDLLPVGADPDKGLHD